MAIGVTQLIVILLLIFILFGAGKLPQVMGDLGKALRQFRKSVNTTEGEIVKEAKKTSRITKKLASPKSKVKSKVTKTTKKTKS